MYITIICVTHMSNSLPKSSNLELYNVDRYPSGKSEIPVSGHDNTTTIPQIKQKKYISIYRAVTA